MAGTKPDPRPLGANHSWAKTPGTYISGSAAIDGADKVARDMELKWGADRLRLLVTLELREKFDRQRYLFNQAIWHGDLAAVQEQSRRMLAAWMALDRAAEAAGAPKLDGAVWELTMSDGSVAALVRDGAHAKAVIAEGRDVRVYTLDEIGRLLEAYPQIAVAKDQFPGATVTALRPLADPLDRLRDSDVGIDDPLDDPIPNLGA